MCIRDSLSPVSLENGTLICRKMELGTMDASGRAGVTETDEMVEVPADTVIVAVGEKVPAEFYEANGINVNERGKAKLDQETLETVSYTHLSSGIISQKSMRK